MICKTCTGTGSILTCNSGVSRGLEFWSCPACGGNGVRIMFGPPEIHVHKLRIKKRK